MTAAARWGLDCPPFRDVPNGDSNPSCGLAMVMQHEMRRLRMERLALWDDKDKESKGLCELTQRQLYRMSSTERI